MGYRDRREACKAALFARVGEQHGVSVDEVSHAVERRRIWLDVMVVLVFAALYVVVAHHVAGRLFRGALADSLVLAAGVAIVTSMAFGRGRRPGRGRLVDADRVDSRGQRPHELPRRTCAVAQSSVADFRDGCYGIPGGH
jgi:hypothetical protein